MARIVWTEPALQELDEIADYISLDNSIAAKKLVREVFKRVDHLAHHPKSGKLVEEFEATIYREIVNPPCRIFYRLAGKIVYIIHVIREEQFLHIDILKSR
ncbi:type II toxin-antitoxin system RelE/ParE family toxin [Rhodohalobacter sp. SW132]|uniref:type II toxin-antitoxin system RelE/ParE family toxin n=1 Tax=Rhodohalobacter sp. SW132 TaxID=2293433 RepID=UPI000E25844B|nr:type II toxin-antitoxin system RelE/ParE family toxin [Rhodohalobacter sp. SW132]REL37790.1 type II toxin-antitoxin system RelE/ParE family toxin [Rhodohalobacter sp. SW132]